MTEIARRRLALKTGALAGTGGEPFEHVASSDGSIDLDTVMRLV
jgi:hypothetical protein